MASQGTLCRAPAADLELLAESLTLSAGEFVEWTFVVLGS